MNLEKFSDDALDELARAFDEDITLNSLSELATREKNRRVDTSITEIPVNTSEQEDGSVVLQFFEESDVEAKEPARQAILSSPLDEGAPFDVSGIVLGPGDVTYGLEQEYKYWPESTLREATDSLVGKNLVTDHENTVHSVVGEITEAKYMEGQGVFFRGEVDDRDIAEKVNNGRLDISGRIFHGDISEMEQDKESGAYIVDVAAFGNVSFVTKPGASSSNQVQISDDNGPIEAAALKEAF